MSLISYQVFPGIAGKHAEIIVLDLSTVTQENIANVKQLVHVTGRALVFGTMVVLSQRGKPKEFFLVDENQDFFHLEKAIPFFPNTFSVLVNNRPPDYWFHPHYPTIQNYFPRVCIDLKSFQAELLEHATKTDRHEFEFETYVFYGPSDRRLYFRTTCKTLERFKELLSNLEEFDEMKDEAFTLSVEFQTMPASSELLDRDGLVDMLQTGSAFYLCYLNCPKEFQELPRSEDDDFW